MNRRSFVISAATAAASRHAAGANDRIRVGIIGSGNRGQYLMKHLNQTGLVQWVAAADVYDVRRDAAEKTAGTNITKLGDYRKLLDQKDIEAVVIAAPDHWHARMLIDAVGAGKDVFCEKPMVTTPADGLAVVKAVRDSRRVVQIGTQQRSLPVIQEAKAKFIDTGAVGKITMVHCQWNVNAGYVMVKIPEEMETKPAGLDWEAWEGNLPKTPWNAKKYFRPFCFWGPSTGPSGNLLIHFLDVIHWYLGLRRPSWGVSMGDILYYKDGRDVPDTFTSALEYPEGVVVSFDCCSPDQTRKEGIVLEFMGTEGRLHVFRSGYRFIPKDKSAEEQTAPGTDGPFHETNWLDCIRDRKQPNANVIDGHYLATASYLSSRAWFEKRPQYWQESWDLPKA